MTLLLILGLATARLTRFLIDDTFIDGPRKWWRNWLGIGIVNDVDHPRLAKVWQWVFDLLECPWCLSAWIAAGAVFAADLLGSVTAPVLLWGAVWWVGSVAYWLGELIFEAHNDIWDKRDRRP